MNTSVPPARTEAPESLLVELVGGAAMVKPVPAPPAPEPDDRMLRNLPAVRLDPVLVTGDRALLLDEGMSGRAISPAHFMEGEAVRP